MDSDFCTYCERPTNGGLYCSEYCRLEDGGWEDMDSETTADQGYDQIIRARIPSTSSHSSVSSMSISRTSSLSDSTGSVFTASTVSSTDTAHTCHDDCKCMSKADLYLPETVEIDILNLLDSGEYRLQASPSHGLEEDFEIDFSANKFKH